MTKTTEYWIDEFVNVQPGEPFRLFPFGTIVKNGQKREVTPEIAQQFKLPHFKPAIKLGSHAEETPAGGHIIGLEVRHDGLYAIPEYNDNGTSALVAGSYRYHSPEVVWEGGFEDPNTGELIAAPLIVGDALLHMPHLGEAAALYSVEPYKNNGGKNVMSEQTVTVPTSLWDKIEARFFKSPDAEPEPQPVVESPKEDYAAELQAAQAEVDAFKAKVAEMEAAQAKAAKVQAFAASFKETTLADDTELHELLAGLPEETATAVTSRFTALAEQVRVSNLTTDIGSEGEGDVDPVQALDTAIKAEMKEKNVDYNTAVATLTQSNPDLFKSAGYGA